MSARTEVLNLLTTAFTAATVNAKVIEYSRDIETFSKDTVMIRIDEVNPSQLPNILRVYNYALICIVPQTTPGVADLALDNLLEDVLDALEGSAVRNKVVWTKATRATYGEQGNFPAYQVDISVHYST